MNHQRLVNRLKQDEGFSPVAFWDDAEGGGKGQWTYGYGTEAPGEHARITEETAAKVLEIRANVAIREFRERFGSTPFMNDIREEALVNMLFNLGGTRFWQFKKLIAAVVSEDWGHAAYEAFDSLWFRQVPKRAKRIVWELLTGQGGSND